MAIMKTWPGSEGLQFILTLTATEEEDYQSLSVIVETLVEIFKPQHNEYILSLQYCQLVRQCE